MAHGNGIADIYKSVIADVISNMKEAFLDENIDVDVLSQLKKEWEDKVNSSGCVDLESNAPPPAPRQQHVTPNPVRPNPIPNHRINPNVQQQQPQRSALAALHAAQMGDTPIRMAYTAQTVQHPQQVRMFPQQFQGGMPFQPGQVFVVQQPGGQNLPMTIMPNQLQHRIVQQGQPQQIPQHQQGNQLTHMNMNQMDGNGGSESDDEGCSEPLHVRQKKAKASMKVRGTGASKKEAMKVLGSMLKEIQLDGGGGGMSDSSSEEEGEEDDDPLRRIADRMGNGEVEDGDQVAEEEPLNSEDDQSDDEDLTMLFDAENVVMCQFEKVNRARTKWKFQLKDGIMHIDKKDYCFQKCTGEAEW
ncbi:CRE-PQN-51 protein [Caenorhabditis remanei]|uniref:CRE-PQN-51 protein n=1 Tax=Caenorhabditis remanei TaxID=31234 RepID=E3LP02_CAERE|nr:CRE-PQN-51 protein [Caenorhabditis remanei]